MKREKYLKNILVYLFLPEDTTEQWDRPEPDYMLLHDFPAWVSALKVLVWGGAAVVVTLSLSSLSG